MPIPSPNLDDRNFGQLLDDAKALVARANCGWTDLSAGDPGAVLLEVFAYITGLLIYRMNRLPEKVHVELLRLIGVKLVPPSAARALLRFSLAQPQDDAVTIPAGTRVTVARASGGEPPVFATAETVSIPAGGTEVGDVLAFHCEQIDAEAAGVGSGLPRQSVRVSQPPVVAPTGDDLDLVVGVEATSAELGERVPAISVDGTPYRIWRRVESFTEGGVDGFSYLLDRVSGLVTFAPAVHAIAEDGRLDVGTATLARVPPAGRRILLWYRRGGGEDGNVAANTLTVMRDPIRGVLVTNPQPAAGGAAAESIENAMLRGPEEMHSLRRAVTARDFEAVALRSSAAVARAKAFTKAELWSYAPAGTVEVLIVPRLGSVAQRGGAAVTGDSLRAQETDDVRQQILVALDQRRPLGTACLVNWVRYKTVQVKVRVVVHRGEDADAVRARVLDRLHLTLNPLPTTLQATGWPFGEPLRASHVYDIVLAEPGVSYADRVRFVVDEVPDKDASAVVFDPFQRSTWYASSNEILFRSLNDGDGWEAAGRFDGELVDNIVPNPWRAGLIAASGRMQDDTSRVHVSLDSGESWSLATGLAFAVNDLAWLERDDVSVLLMATDKGLYELAMEPGASPLQLLVDNANAARGFYAVVSFVDGRGGRNVAVAARQSGGIFISRSGGRTGSFAAIQPGGDDIRVLAVQRLGTSTYLWAGITTAGNEPGKGALRWELPSSPQSIESPEGWRAYASNWQGGSCRALAFDGGLVHAGTHFAGVARLDGARPDDGWTVSDIQCGLPMRGSDKLFAPVLAIAAAANGGPVMTGGGSGVFRSDDGGARFERASSREFAEKVALPPTWLFCSGAHEVIVVSADATKRD